jgi:hypothetical protein
MPPMSIKPLLNANIASLCSLIHTIFGNTDTKEASVAPAPKLTRSAGMAQQMRVLELAKRLIKALI